MFEDKKRYPLCWPDGWAKTNPAHRRDSRFARPVSYSARLHSMDEGCIFLSHELELMGATRQILSTNVELRLDGRPYSNRSSVADPGAAVYFSFIEKPVTLACDKWRRVEDNVWAIGKHVQALRGQDRWGVGTLEQAFRGYMALPGIGETSGIKWWEVLGVPINASADQVKEAYRLLCKKHHPDVNGDSELFRRVNSAYQMFENIGKQ